MPEVLGVMKQMTEWVFWLFDRAWQWAGSIAIFIGDVWRDGPLWKQIGFLAVIVLLGSMVLAVGPKAILLLRRVVGGLIALTVVLMMVVPTLAITFLAVLGGLWIAKSF
jgi:hypothetical protein